MSAIAKIYANPLCQKLVSGSEKFLVISEERLSLGKRVGVIMFQVGQKASRNAQNYVLSKSIQSILTNPIAQRLIS